MNNHYKIIHYKKTFDALIKNKTITSLGRYKSSFYINKRKLFFKEEVDRMHYELLGNSIAEYLNINYTYYEPTTIKTATREIKGLVAKDYRREGYSLVKFNKLLNGKEMTLNNIKIALDIYFNDYINKEELVNKIYSEVIKHYMLDLLIGNNDNGEYNYEMMVSKDNAYLSPYSDFGLTFNFTSTRLRVNEEVNNSIYSNLKILLKEDKIVKISGGRYTKYKWNNYQKYSFTGKVISYEQEMNSFLFGLSLMADTIPRTSIKLNFEFSPKMTNLNAIDYHLTRSTAFNDRFKKISLINSDITLQYRFTENHKAGFSGRIQYIPLAQGNTYQGKISSSDEEITVKQWDLISSYGGTERFIWSFGFNYSFSL